MSDDSTLQIDLSRNPELLDVRRVHVLVVDVQEKLIPVIQQNDAVVNSISFLLNCCRLLDVPVILSEQYPKGLGSTIDAIGQQDFAIVRSMVFLGSVLYIVGLILTDISYTLVDPRIRLE